MKVEMRRYQLLRMLCRTKEYRPMSYYAQSLDVTARTIANDLNALEEMLAPYQLRLERKPNYGVLLRGRETELERVLREFSQLMGVESLSERHARQAEILRLIILEDQTATYEKLSSALCVSTSVVAKDMSDLRQFESEHCKIVSDATGTRVEGTEYGKQKLLRDFFNSYLNTCHPDVSKNGLATILKGYYPESVVRAVAEALDSLQAIFKSTLEDHYLNSLFIFLATIATRKLRGRELTADHGLSPLESIELLSNYYLAVEISERLKEKLGISFTTEEIDYISYQLFIHKVELNINNKYLEDILGDHVREFIKRIGRAVGRDLFQDQTLYDALIYHLIPMIYRIKSDISIENPILNEVKSNYPVLFNLTWFHLNDLAKDFGITLSEDEVSFITIHLQVALERISPRGHVVIVCETGLLTSELLVNRIRKNLPSTVELKVVPLNRIDQEDVTSADFIVSTISLENLAKPYIKVSPLVTDEEMKEVYDHYLKYSESEIVRFSQSGNCQMRFLSKLFVPELIQINSSMKTKEQCIEHLADCLYKANCVEAGFANDIFTRESLGSTYLAPGVSVPHAMTENVKRSALCILVLPSGLHWDGLPVRLVLMLAIKEEDADLIVEELPALYKKVLNEQFVAEVANLTDVGEVRRMFLR